MNSAYLTYIMLAYASNFFLFKAGLTPLHEAAYSGEKTTCEFLVEAGASLNAQDQVCKYL